MKNVIDVFTGDVKSADTESELVSHAIGSCVVVTAFDPKNHIGAMAHIMLPGKAPENRRENRLRYAEDAINELLIHFDKPHNMDSDIKFCLIGAGNVLKRKDDTICRINKNSVREILAEKGLKIAAQALGGTKRRSVRLNVHKGTVYYSEGGSKEILLWKNDE